MAQSTNQTVKFGLGQISNVAPEWATWIFRGYFILSKAVLGWLAATHLIPQASLYEVITLITFLLDPLFYGVSKLFGIEPEQPDPSLPMIADRQIQPGGDTKVINPTVVPVPTDASGIVDNILAQNPIIFYNPLGELQKQGKISVGINTITPDPITPANAHEIPTAILVSNSPAAQSASNFSNKQPGQ